MKPPVFFSYNVSFMTHLICKLITHRILCEFLRQYFCKQIVKNIENSTKSKSLVQKIKTIVQIISDITLNIKLRLLSFSKNPSVYNATAALRSFSKFNSCILPRLMFKVSVLYLTNIIRLIDFIFTIPSYTHTSAAKALLVD